MKKNIAICAAAATVLAACAQTKEAEGETQYIDKGNYTEVLAPEVDLSSLAQDADGYYILFDGSSLNGWRGYGKENVPGKWTIEDGCLKFNGTGGGEAQWGEGGDIIFAHRFQNFELEFDWKVDKGSNSGVFILAREIMTRNDAGEMVYEPIYISAPEYQILDNANHPDAGFGVDGNRQSASLYDMIPAKPQNQNPWGEWNKGRITVYQGAVFHGQNDEKQVVEYHLWSPRWTEMLQNSKFSEQAWPLAFELLNNCGGDEHKGYIGFQDHGDVVWYKNIRVKVLD